MNRRLRWRVAITVAVTLGMSIFAWYPLLADHYGLLRPGFILNKRLQLGLDLKGGVHMILRVNTDDALRAETAEAAARLDEALTRDGVSRGAIDVTAPGEFRVHGVASRDAAAVRRIADDLAIDFDPVPGVDDALTFTMPQHVRAERHLTTVEQARQVVERRVDELGVAEPLMAVQGENGDELLVQLPGTRDVARAIDIVGATALLEWKLVEHGPAASRERLLASVGGVVPPDGEVVVEPGRTGAGEAPGFYLVRKVSIVTGRDLRSARSSLDEYNRPAVAFSLTREGAQRFAAFTSGHVGRLLAIVLDGRVQSAPVIEGPIESGEGHIRGRFSPQEAADLSLVLRAGALPASMTYLGGGFVGPSLGTASVQAGLVASLAGLALVGAFMLLYYNRAGLNATASIVVNLLLLLGAMAYAGGVLTLPGIAGLILTIGMGVDSNVLIFERIKEELAGGKSARAAVAAGFDRVFLTILDTHIASLIAAAFLFQFGTGPIRGFATTLTFGLLSNVFTAVFVSRTLFEVGLALRRGPLRISTFAHRLRALPVDVHRWRWPAAAVSLAVIALGIGLMAVRGIPLGIEFSGGTLLNVTFEAPVSEEAIHGAIDGDEVVQRFGDASGHTMLIRLPQEDATEDIAERVDKAVAALQNAGLPQFEVDRSETVGPAVGADLQRKGLYATAASLAGITAYIAFRFRPAFAVGAIAATCHDILITVAVLAASGYELSLNVVAAVLTITGYSVNDTIVTFDRVRENLRTLPRQPLADIVNLAVGQTLGRTMITGGTTFMAVLALYLFGGDALRGFSFAMLVGIAVGTYSTIFIATGIAVTLTRRNAPRSVT